MKNKILVLTLVLVVAAVAVVCVSCSKKEKEYREELCSFKVINQTGEKITEIVMEDTRSVSRMKSRPAEGGWPDGQTIIFSMSAAMENNAPDLKFTVVTESGNILTTSILRKDVSITVRSGEDGLQLLEESLAE